MDLRVIIKDGWDFKLNKDFGWKGVWKLQTPKKIFLIPRLPLWSAYYVKKELQVHGLLMWCPLPYARWLEVCYSWSSLLMNMQITARWLERLTEFSLPLSPFCILFKLFLLAQPRCLQIFKCTPLYIICVWLTLWSPSPKEEQDPNSAWTPCFKLEEKVKLVSERRCWLKAGNSCEVNLQTELSVVIQGRTYTCSLGSCLKENHYEH